MTPSYLIKRGSTLHLRLRVPARLRQLIGRREITRSMKAGNQKKLCVKQLRSGYDSRKFSRWIA
ncbi:DUF6538 domain-containing protein [Andreprevotia lacus]|uniref:DUF6538 domain-containing protein n=1 Tax=Andreprevotia lacus TaxID=1121000 RepID=UPI003570EB6B